MKKKFIKKSIRNSAIMGLLATGMFAMTAQTAMAENGGNGEGQLEVFASQPTINNPGTPVTALQWNHTYYIELQNPGGKAKLQNIVSSPNQVTFNFFTPPRTFKGDPGKWDLKNKEFTVAGTSVYGPGPEQKSPYIYKVKLPSQGSYKAGDYEIEAGQVAMHKNHGEDEMYFAYDPSIGGQLSIINPPSGQLPEVPYAGILPVLVLLGGGYLYLRRRRKTAR